MGKHCLSCTCGPGEPTENQIKLSKKRCLICNEPAWPHDKDHTILIRLTSKRKHGTI